MPFLRNPDPDLVVYRSPAEGGNNTKKQPFCIISNTYQNWEKSNENVKDCDGFFIKVLRNENNACQFGYDRVKIRLDLLKSSLKRGILSSESRRDSLMVHDGKQAPCRDD